MAAALSRASAASTMRALKRGVVLELLITGIDFFTGQGAEPVHPEFLATEAAHDGTVNHGAAQFGKIEFSVGGRDAAARQMANETAGEAIARAGRVEDVFQQIARDHEVLTAAEQDGAVLATIDHQRVRTHLHDLGGGAAQVVFAREQAGFAVVAQQEVPLLQSLEQRRTEIVDPVVHGVAAGELDIAHLVAHTALQIGLDVAQEEIRLGAVALRQPGIEIREDVEIGLQGLAIVHIGRVLTGPEEGLAGDAVEAGEIDLAGRQKIEVFLREVLADDADDFDLREIRGGEGDIRARSAEHAVYFSMRRFDAVIGNGSNHDEGHVRPDCSNRLVAIGGSLTPSPNPVTT